MNTFTAYLECQCRMKEHVICLEHEEDFGLQISVQTRHYLDFWSRVKAAFKYVFSRSARHGLHWDSTWIKNEDVETIQKWIDQAKKNT